MNEQHWSEVLYRAYERDARVEEERRGELAVTALFLVVVALIILAAVLT